MNNDVGQNLLRELRHEKVSYDINKLNGLRQLLPNFEKGILHCHVSIISSILICIFNFQYAQQTFRFRFLERLTRITRLSDNLEMDSE